MMLPSGARDADCRWRVIVDPIDGTREIMYQKRSAWILTGVAPNRGDATRVQRHRARRANRDPDPQAAPVRPALGGARARRARHAVQSRAGVRERVARCVRRARPTLAHGFASVSRFFPGVRDVLAAIDDEIIAEVARPPVAARRACFEDQYLSTGGQFYELMAGHDRFIADIRPLAQADPRGARHSGAALLSSVRHLHRADRRRSSASFSRMRVGGPIDAPFDVETDVSWAGYANAAIRASVEPALQNALRRRRVCCPWRYERATSRWTSRAPGRLDVMGGIADYSGALVLQLPLDRATTVSLRRTASPHCDITSVRGDERAHFRIALSNILDGGALSDPPRSCAVARRARAGSLGGVRRRGRSVLLCKSVRARRGGAAWTRARDRIDGARGKGRELVGRARGRDDDGGRCELRHRANAGGHRGGVSVGREPRRRRAVRHHGPDDERVRQARPAASVALSARHDRRPHRNRARFPVLWNRFRRSARGDGRGLRHRSRRGVHGVSHDRRPRGSRRRARWRSRRRRRSAMARIPREHHDGRIRRAIRRASAGAHAR